MPKLKIDGLTDRRQLSVILRNFGFVSISSFEFRVFSICSGSGSMMYAGIDAGSRAIKVVLIGEDGLEVVAKGQVDQGVEQDKLACQLFEKVLAQAGVGRSQVRRIVATGYGRNAVSIADTTITEITCHAVGVRQLVPAAMTA
jgi:activator of 2-hydroxyglutaryl-CoA dehydratase